MDSIRFESMPLSMFLLLVLVVGLIVFILLIEPRLSKKKIKNNNEHGSSKFADMKEIKDNFNKEDLNDINKAGFPVWYEKENSKFKNAKFKNAIFEGANLDGTDFKDAKFENTIFLGCKLEKIKNFNAEVEGVRIFEGMPEINISSELEEALKNLMENKFVKNSRIFDTKEGNINTLTLMILKENFSEEELIKGFNEIKLQIDRDFYTISYVIRLINKVLV